MPEATNTPSTPRADRYVRAATTIPVTFNQPGPTARSKPRVVTGHLLGTMHAGGQVHHYRIEGADSVLYLVPPTWLVAASRAAIAAGVAGATREYNSRAELLQELATDWGLNVTIHALNAGVMA